MREGESASGTPTASSHGRHGVEVFTSGTVSVYIDDPWTICVLGELDIAASNAVNAALSIAWDQPQVRIDVSGVTFADSHGLALLLRCVQTRRTVVLIGSSQPLRRLLELTDTADLFEYESGPT